MRHLWALAAILGVIQRGDDLAHYRPTRLPDMKTRAATPFVVGLPALEDASISTVSVVPFI
jgi:hypothetical protein